MINWAMAQYKIPHFHKTKRADFITIFEIGFEPCGTQICVHIWYNIKAVKTFLNIELILILITLSTKQLQ